MHSFETFSSATSYMLGISTQRWPRALKRVPHRVNGAFQAALLRSPYMPRVSAQFCDQESLAIMDSWYRWADDGASTCAQPRNSIIFFIPNFTNVSLIATVCHEPSRGVLAFNCGSYDSLRLRSTGNRTSLSRWIYGEFSPSSLSIMICTSTPPRAWDSL